MYTLDFSESEDSEFDGFDDDENFLASSRQRRHERYNYYNREQTDEEKREKRLREFFSSVMNNKNDKVIEELNNGFSVNENLKNDWNPILVACSVSNYDLVVEFHKRGANLKSTRAGFTTVMLACNCPQNTASTEKTFEVVKYLLENGVDPKVINRKRMTALMLAAYNGNFKVVELLFPISDPQAQDNQNWNALFWAVQGGHIEIVDYLLNNNLPFDKVDVYGNTILDCALENGSPQLIELFTTDEENDFVADDEYDYERIFHNDNPRFFNDIRKVLYGAHCENLTKLIASKEIDLTSFLSLSEDDLKILGVDMPYQRRRLLTGIYRLHQRPFQSGSIPVVTRNEIYSNIETAGAILSAVKQLITMESSLRFITKNADYIKFVKDPQIHAALRNIQNKMKSLDSIVTKLENKTKTWDLEIVPVDCITKNSGKRWFPWRKSVVAFGLLVSCVIFVKRRL